MKKLIFLTLTVALGWLAVYIYPAITENVFGISGTVNISTRLKNYTKSPHLECFIIVKNMGDVPIAIKKVVNPSFPLDFNITKEDLMLEGSSKGPFKLEVQLNSHGNIGTLKSGDMFGKAAVPVVASEKKADITIDKMYGVPLMAKNTDKGKRIFSTAAR